MNGVELLQVVVYSRDGKELRLHVRVATEIETTELVSPACVAGELRMKSGTYRTLADVRIPTLDEISSAP